MLFGELPSSEHHPADRVVVLDASGFRLEVLEAGPGRLPSVPIFFYSTPYICARSPPTPDPAEAQYSGPFCIKTPAPGRNTLETSMALAAQLLLLPICPLNFSDVIIASKPQRQSLKLEN